MAKLAHLILLFSLFLIFSSCNNKNDSISQNPKEQNLKIILTDPVETLDPLHIIYKSDWEVASNIYEGLVSLDESYELVYEIIDTVIISDDKKTYKFTLNNNTVFHDNSCFPDGIGRKLNSKDIYYTFQRLSTPGNDFSNWQLISNKITGLQDYHHGLVDSITGIKIIDSQNFVITLNKPFEPFLKILTTPNFYIVPREAIEKYGHDFSKNAVGTGPFRLAEYTHHKNIILVKNNKYHKFDKSNSRLPYLSSINYHTISDEEDRFRELIRGNTHLINANKNEHNLFLSDSLLRKQFSEKKIPNGLGVRFWAFYFDDESDNQEYKNIRRQIRKNYNRDFLTVNEPKIQLAESLVPEFLIGSKVEPYTEESNIKSYQMSINYPITIMANLEYIDLLELEITIKNINLPCERVIKPAGYYSEINNIKPTLFRVSMVPAFPDPIEYYALFYSKNSQSINLGCFSNKKYDQYFELLQIEHDEELKLHYYNELENILRKEVAAIYLSHSGSESYLFNSKLKQLKFKFLMPDYRKAFFE